MVEGQKPDDVVAFSSRRRWALVPIADGVPQTHGIIVLALRYLGPPGRVLAAERGGD
jgi:hypothetical protein